jgi:uncharacterized protein
MKNTPQNLSEKPILTDQDLNTWYCSNWAPPRTHRIKLKIVKYIHQAMQGIFTCSGFFHNGFENSLDLQIEYIDVPFSNLPDSFHNTKILFLSDFHLGVVKELPEIIISKIKNLEFDLCLLGGDYRHCATHPSRPFLADLEKILLSIRPPLGIYGVLGNHDGPELIPALERMGVKMLVNDSVSIIKGKQHINLVGVDEFNVFRRHDLNKAFQGVFADEFTMFLSHSPDLFKQAQVHGADLYLCGHTHHGQIQLPIIGPVLTFSSAPRGFTIGTWNYKTMTGYTGPGLGTVAASVRFKCPPKVVVLTLCNTAK